MFEFLQAKVIMLSTVRFVHSNEIGKKEKTKSN